MKETCAKLERLTFALSVWIGTPSQEAINGLVRAMQALYPEQENEVVKDMGVKFASMIQKERFATRKELAALRKAAANASSIFPPDFVELNLRKSFNVRLYQPLGSENFA